MTQANGGSGIRYRERLSPSLWVLVAAALCGPMAALVFSPIDTTAALVIGGAVGFGIVALLVMTSPVLEVADGILRAGRARIEVAHLGPIAVLTGEQARQARGAALDPRSWHVIRGGIDPVAVIPILDPDDPAPAWVVSSRTPERLAAAVRRAQAVSA